MLEEVEEALLMGELAQGLGDKTSLFLSLHDGGSKST